ncbi:MAG: hypothetical protein N2747_06450 [Chitinophagaceae bacterium]|nr:hypothetical protein [Chitinophagaceae bacterium]
MKPFVPSKVAEIVFALILLFFAYGHFKNTDAMAGFVPSYFPGPAKIYVYVTGVALGLAAIAIILDMQKTLACYLLAAMLLIFAFTLHLKGFNENPVSFLKDTALAMTAILIGNRK